MRAQVPRRVRLQQAPRDVDPRWSRDGHARHARVRFVRRARRSARGATRAGAQPWLRPEKGFERQLLGAGTKTPPVDQETIRKMTAVIDIARSGCALGSLMPTRLSPRNRL